VPGDSVSIRIYSGIARFPCDSMAFLFEIIITVFCLHFPLISVKILLTDKKFPCL